MNATLECPPANPTEIPAKTNKVLVVDDSIVNQRLTLALLKQRNYDAHAAGDGREAVRILCEEAVPFDVVLMDCHMPEMDGFEATTAIRAHDGPNRDIIIVALTGTLAETQMFRCDHSGMDDYLDKPIKIDDFESTWERCREERAAKETKRSSDTEYTDNRAPFWDDARLAKLRSTMGDEAEEFIGEMLGIFLADAPRMIESVQAAVEAADGAALRDAAHCIKGASRNLGLIRISEVSTELEEISKGGDLTAAMYWFKRLKSLTNQVADKACEDQGIALPS